MNYQTPDLAAVAELKQDFARLHALTRTEPPAGLDLRRDRLKRLLALMHDNEAAFERAIAADFGHRSHHETRLAETMVLEAGIKHTLRHLKGWMKSRRMATHLAFMPGANRLQPQPLGVVGVISPWNYPLQLALGPMAGALAAGNRVMLKPSELVPAFSEALKGAVARAFSPDEAVVATGGVETAREFSGLPFDHLVFTGSTAVGRIVAQAAAKNLTPVTLELGGKSPAILDASADVAKAAQRIAFGKLLNAGQTCIAPDYVLCAAGQVEPFAAAFRAKVAALYGSDPANPDYSGIVSQKHFDRLCRLVDEAVAGGARALYAVDNPDAWKARRKFPPCLVLDTTEAMALRQEEIFGPVLPIVVVPDASAAIAYVNAHDRPLALYWFGTDAAARDRVLAETVSGGVTVNDCLLHIAQESQPFGGVGPSGMGHYHGEYGFRALSKEKPVYYRSELNFGLGLMAPPYNARFDRLLGLVRRIL